MRITITILFLAIIQFSFICKTQSQTMLWDERYTETVFSDDFLGSTLNRDNWDISIFKRDIGILIDSSATYRVNNGNLELTMIYCPNCEATDWAGKTYNGNYAGAEVVSKVPPFQYGVFECRAKYATNLGSWPAFWTIGGDGTPCPPGGYGNEIDIAELKCQTWVTKMGHVIHRYYPPDDCDESNVVVKDIDLYNIQLNNIYYDYKCIWTPSKISYYINNSLMHEVQNTGQEWYPELYLRMILSQQIITASNISGQFTVITPQTSYFDKVSVKRFFSTPEITCPSLICTNGTAIMDVDDNASNITWSLTPTNLFSGTKTGTGKTASITAATGASGQGKITYSFSMPSGEIFTAEKTFWVGKPGIFDVSDFDKFIINSADGGDWYVCTDQAGNGFDLSYYRTYSMCTNFEIKITNLNNTYTYDHFYSTYGNGDLDYPNLQEGWYLIWARGYNGCGSGWGDWTESELEFVECSLTRLFFSPNPTTGETTLSIETTSAEKTFDETAEWELEIYDQSQTLKEKKTKLKGKEHKIQTAGWKEGVYAVRVKYKDEILTGKLVVKK